MAGSGVMGVDVRVDSRKDKGKPERVRGPKKHGRSRPEKAPPKSPPKGRGK